MKHRYLFMVSGLFALLYSCNIHNVKKENLKIKQSLDSLLHSEHEFNNFHGGIIITGNHETVYENYIGIANEKQKIQISKNTKFDIASLNKSFISALVLKAVEDNKLNLEDKLVNLLDQYNYEGNFDSQITIHQMMCHISGLPDYASVSDSLKKNNYQLLKTSHFYNSEYINFISKLKPVNKPNKQFHYSNFSYHILAILLENIYQKTFDKILKDNLAVPLGLKNTVAEMKSRKQISNLAKGYIRSADNLSWQKQTPVDLSLGRRIFSSVSDLNRWGQVMSNPGYLSSKSLALMKKNHLKNLTNIVSYGYGWAILDKKNQSSFGNLKINKNYIIHGGNTDGYKAMLVNINNSEFVISFLSNHNYKNELLLTKKITNLLNL